MGKQDKPRGGPRLMDKLLHRRALTRWSRAAASAPETELDALRVQLSEAKQLRGALDELIHVAEGRLALPRIGSSAFPKPGGTDWSWRPQLWRGPLAIKGQSAVPTREKIGTEVTVFHDCDISELTLRQIRNTREADLAPYGLRMDVFRFDGSFLSLAIDLPEGATSGLRKRHLIRLDPTIEVEKPIEIFARLNIRHGPNTEQLVRELPMNDGNLVVEFDLGYSNMNEKRVEAIWLDLIFEGPEMNQITIRDIAMSRYPRAEL